MIFVLKVEKVQVWGFEHAIRGMRNPYDSWAKSDSGVCTVTDCYNCNGHWSGKPCFVIGANDLALMRKLYAGGSEHRKFLRQIIVSMDITAPLYWWKEFDTYKVGTVANSCSTMHRIQAKEFTLDDFSTEHLFDFMPEETEHDSQHILEITVDWLNRMREKYLETKNKDYWWQLIQLLPTSYNQKRTVTMNYENAVTIIKQRNWHRLDEWHTLIAELIKLPNLAKIIGK